MPYAWPDDADLSLWELDVLDRAGVNDALVGQSKSNIVNIVRADESRPGGRCHVDSPALLGLRRWQEGHVHPGGTGPRSACWPASFSWSLEGYFCFMPVTKFSASSICRSISSRLSQ